jgi:rod shape-determining protein MreD
MRLLVVGLASYAALVAETTILRELLPESSAPLCVWGLLPLLAVSSQGANGVLAAAGLGLAVDACSSGPLGIHVGLSALATWLLQRVVSVEGLSSSLRVGLLSGLSATLTGMASFVASSLLTPGPVEPAALLSQFGFAALLAGAWAVGVSRLLNLRH